MVLEAPRSERGRQWPEAALLIRLDRSAHHVAGTIVHGAVIVSPEHRSGIWHGHFLRVSLLDPPEIRVELVHSRRDYTRKRHRPLPLPGGNAGTRNPMRHLWAVLSLADQFSTAQRWQLHCASTARVPGTNDSAGHARRGGLESCVARRVGDMRPARCPHAFGSGSYRALRAAANQPSRQCSNQSPTRRATQVLQHRSARDRRRPAVSVREPSLTLRA